MQKWDVVFLVLFVLYMVNFVQCNTEEESATPSNVPSHSPSTSPANSPTLTPSGSPTVLSTHLPTANPTNIPTSSSPTNNPTVLSTHLPTANPTNIPTSSSPTNSSPTNNPTSQPTSPTARPSSSPTFSPTKQDTTRTNIVMFVIDDLAARLGSNGDPAASTPRMDELARRGLNLQNHHVQLAECSPSRMSMFTGLRPDTIKLFGREGSFRVRNPTLETLPGFLRGRHEYRTYAVGKVLDWAAFRLPGEANNDFVHLEECARNASRNVSGTAGCSFDLYVPPNENVRNCAGFKYFPTGGSNPLYYGLNVPEATFNDGHTSDHCVASTAISFMQFLSLDNQTWPFFLAIGFSKPHLPFTVPSKYWEAAMVNQQRILAITQGQGTAFYTGSSPQSQVSSFSRSTELGDYDDMNPGGTGLTNKLMFAVGYYAAMSFVDAQVGRVMDYLDSSPFQRNTLIVLWGDNGMHFGPGIYGKKTVFDDATKVPLLIVPPAREWNRKWRVNVNSAAPVESIDVFPTVLDLLNIPIPPELEGRSLTPLFACPQCNVKAGAVSQYRDGRSDFDQVFMGYTVRSRNYRIINFYDFNKNCWDRTKGCSLMFGRAAGTRIELYQMQESGRSLENVNFAYGCISEEKYAVNNNGNRVDITGGGFNSNPIPTTARKKKRRRRKRRGLAEERSLYTCITSQPLSFMLPILQSRPNGWYLLYRNETM